MNKEEDKYLDLLKEILENGDKKEDRTGVGTLSLFGTSLRFSLKNNTIPLLTTKKVFFKGVVEELLFFMRGDTDTKKLEAKGVNIWKGNTSREFLDKKGLHRLPEGSLGKGYGFQWRQFGATKNCDNGHCRADDSGIDQLQQVIDTLKINPNDRRMIISAWNPQQLDEMALPPCHMMAQFYTSNNKLSCQFYQRSVDSFLGLPFNIASYALMTHIIAKAVGMEAKEVIFIGGDTHIYSNHIDQTKIQLLREPFDFPKIKINKEINNVQDIEALEFNNFELIDYKSHPSIKAEMAV